MPPFKLSDPGSMLTLDPAMSEYLRSYDLPLPPLARYGFLRVTSPQKKFRVSLFSQAWLPNHAIGTVAVLHGYSEHSGNYAQLIGDLVRAQFAVITFDFRGHGLSEGPSGHVPLPHTYAEDVETVLKEIFPQLLPERPFFLWAHSMGAMVALQLLLENRLPQMPAALALTSPLLGFPVLSGMQRVLSKVSPFLARFAPTIPVAHGLPPEILSHDESYLARRHEDPLIKRVTTPQWFEATKQSVEGLQKNAAKLSPLSPTLLMLAGQEKVTNLSEARRFAFQAYSGQKHKVIEFPGSFHELEKESGIRTRVVTESIGWFRSHC
ncbi:MAG TPA: alpha/beta fold hydrolase [Bdellovibrionota bacterium]|jgi:lysophospholipase